MGNVRTRVIKSTAKRLLEYYPDLFKPDFEHNKKIVARLISTKSKRVRNQIAGYITHLLRIRERREKQIAALESQETPQETSSQEASEGFD